MTSEHGRGKLCRCNLSSCMSCVESMTALVALSGGDMDSTSIAPSL